MTIQLRQLCLVAEKLSNVIEELSDVLGLNSCYVDPEVAEFGLENTLLPVGRNFLEIVSPIRKNTSAGRHLARRQGDGGYMVITQADSLDNQRRARQIALGKGVRVAHEWNRKGWRGCQLHPKDMQVGFLEIEHDTVSDFQGHWMPAGGEGWEAKVKQDVVVDFIGVELQCDDPLFTAGLWGAVLGAPIIQQEDTVKVVLNNAYLRFVTARDGRGPGLSGIDLLAIDIDGILARAERAHCDTTTKHVDICGTHFYLHQA